MSPFHDLNEMFIGLQSFSADLHGGLWQSLKVPLIGLSFRGEEGRLLFHMTSLAEKIAV